MDAKWVPGSQTAADRLKYELGPTPRTAGRRLPTAHSPGQPMGRHHNQDIRTDLSCSPDRNNLLDLAHQARLQPDFAPPRGSSKGVSSCLAACQGLVCSQPALSSPRPSTACYHCANSGLWAPSELPSCWPSAMWPPNGSSACSGPRSPVGWHWLSRKHTPNSWMPSPVL